MAVSKNFFRRVIDEGFVDTDNYRYVYRIISPFAPVEIVIKRIEKKYLGTSEAYGEWQHVAFVDIDGNRIKK